LSSGWRNVSRKVSYCLASRVFTIPRITGATSPRKSSGRGVIRFFGSRLIGATLAGLLRALVSTCGVIWPRAGSSTSVAAARARGTFVLGLHRDTLENAIPKAMTRKYHFFIIRLSLPGWTLWLRPVFAATPLQH
jgi:hypothetical protein